jgi:hypothetical protein
MVRIRVKDALHSFSEGGLTSSGSELWMAGQSDFREVIQPAVYKPAVSKQRWKLTTGAFELPVPPQVSCPRFRCSLSRIVVQHFPPFLDP